MQFHGNSRSITFLLLGVVCVLTLFLLILFSTDIKATWSHISTPLPPPTATSTQYLETEEVVFVPIATTSPGVSTTTQMLKVRNVLFEYIEVTDGCSTHFQGECLNVRAGPGTDFPVQRQLRNGIILKVGGSVQREDELWYRIVFDEWLRYPERVTGDWYVHSDYVRVLYDEGDKNSWEGGTPASTTKRIVVSRSKQTLTAYDGDTLFMQTPISTGLELTPTPRGTFTIFKKTPSRYMQGPLPNLRDRQVYDLPGVPWNLYFTSGGAVIHGAYWHDSFGSAYSHGCVNLPLPVAQELYNWADLGTTVVVED